MTSDPNGVANRRTWEYYETMPMTQDELSRWAEVEAEDCLRYHLKLPIEEIKRIIAEHLRDAYILGVQQARLA